MKSLHSSYTHALRLVCALLFVCCLLASPALSQDDFSCEGASFVSTRRQTSVTATSAVLGGFIDLLCVYPDRFGIVWATTAGPTTANNKVEMGSSSVSSFSATVTGLPSNTRVYVRAYIQNGFEYGKEISFTTLSDTPTVTTPTSANVAATTATLGGTITTDGGAKLSEIGVVYAPAAINRDPFIGGAGVLQAFAMIHFRDVTVNVTGLLPNTDYVFKAYATNSVGTGYSPANSFRTLSGNNPPTITAETGVTRQQGAAASNSTIANVADVDGGTLTVTVNGNGTATVNGVTVSNLIVSNGVVSADSVAACGATNASFTLTVTDNQNATATATLNVTVTANTPPVLSYGTPGALYVGEAVTVNAANATDNGTITGFALQSVTPAFSGTINVNSNTGAVSVTNAGPIGIYTVTVRATDDCGTTTDASFNLNVIGSLLISEFALSGPNGQNDWFVELYNNTDLAQNTTGLRVGFVNAAGTGYATINLPPNVVVRPRAYYLLAGSAFSITDVTPDFTAAALPVGFAPAGTALSKGAVEQPTQRLDSVGMNNLPPAHFYVETAPVAWLNNPSAKHAFVRKFTLTGFPIDANNNKTDFVLVAPSVVAINGVTPLLGLPGPQSGTSPMVNNGGMPVTLLKPSVNVNVAPNTAVMTENGVGTTRSLYLRRTITNNSGASVKKLRFRIVEMSTGGVGIANLRAQTSVDIVIEGQTVKGLLLENAATQPNGGGVNSTLCEGTITLAQPLAAGAKVNVQFRLGIVSGGSYRFIANVEAQN